MILKSILAVLILLVVLPLLWLASAMAYESWNTYTHRFRLTIEVDDRGVPKSASSVIQVNATGKADWVPQTAGVRYSVRGEAAFLDLGEGRNVVAILGLGPTGDRDIYNLAALAFGRDHPFWQREAPSWRGRAELHVIPSLVTFGDLTDPKSARVLQPDEFERVFGPGVHFRSASIEMVPTGGWLFRALGWPPGLAGEPLSSSIQAKMPWLRNFKGYLSGRFACAPAEPHCLHGGHFLRN